MGTGGGGRTPTLDTDWDDLTDDHENRRETVENSIDNWPDDLAPASYIIGAIGAGKTHLLNHLFEFAYAEAGKPALYVTMGQLLDDIQTEVGYPEDIDVLSQEKLHDVMESIVRQELYSIHEKITAGEEFDRSDYLPDSGRISDIQDYASVLGIEVEEFADLTDRDERVILIVDEMEESYNRLGEMVAQTTGPLREVVGRVEDGESSFYLIGGFGYASVHELGEAEYRRVDPITLPIIKPESIYDVLGEDISTEQRNFTWWMSRGRPGWLEIANRGYSMRPDSLRGAYSTLGDIPSPDMSRVDIIALEELEEYVSDVGTERDLTAITIFRPSPVQINDIGGLGTETVEATGAKILSDSDLTDLDDVTNAFLSGIHQSDEYNESLVSDQLVRRYLVRILRAISNEDDQLVFGAAHVPVFQRGNICKDRMLNPLAERIHDIALEETGDDEQDTVDFLYEISQYIQKTSPEEISAEFADFFDLFTDSGEVDGDTWVGPGLRTLVTVYPSLITNPRLNFAGTGKSEREQLQSVVETLQSDESREKRLVELGEILQEDPR